MGSDRTIERGPDQMLSELARAVAGAATVNDMLRVVAELAAPMLEAANVTASLLDEEQTKLLIYHGSAATTADVRLVDVADPTPAGDAVRTGQPVYLPTIDVLVDRYPSLAARVRASDWGALAVLPMRAGGELVGALMIRYTRPVTFNPEQQDLLAAIAELFGEALARSRNHDRLAAYARKLVESNRDLDHFAAAVAHDLRQPFRQLSSYIHLLIERIGAEQLDADAAHYVDVITVALGRAERLIAALLGYSRVTAKPLANTEVGLKRLVDEVVEMLGPRLDQVSATVRCEDLPVVQGDVDLLRQVFQNLLENSIKYRDPRRPLEIVISARAQETGPDDPPVWKVTVEDNGVGIAPAHLGAVFEVFSRARPANDPGGTGMGLAIVQRIVERHGGEVGVESHPGRGATFWCTLTGAVPKQLW